jgi:hypothetical protein
VGLLVRFVVRLVVRPRRFLLWIGSGVEYVGEYVAVHGYAARFVVVVVLD